MTQPIDTETVAMEVMAAITHDDEGTFDVVDSEPTEDVRTDGAFFTIENADGQRFTVLIVEDGR